MTASAELYRILIPAHAGVKNELVAYVLADVATSLDAAAFGTQYLNACIYLAAHRIERTPGSGANGSTAEEAGAVTSQSASRATGAGPSSSLSRAYAAPTEGPAEEQDLRTTRYGQEFLRLRTSRVARAPTAIPRAAFLGWPWRCS